MLTFGVEKIKAIHLNSQEHKYIIQKLHKKYM